MQTTTERVWETFHVPLQQFIRRRVSDETAAEDLLQDVFLDIHQHIDTLRDVKKLESWIYQVTRNAIIDSYRSKRATTTLRLLYNRRLLLRGHRNSVQEHERASFLMELRLQKQKRMR